MSTTQTYRASIIAARLVTPKGYHECADCGRHIVGRLVRVVCKEPNGKLFVDSFCPHIDQDDEIRGCAPDHEKVRAALRGTK